MTYIWHNFCVFQDCLWNGQSRKEPVHRQRAGLRGGWRMQFRVQGQILQVLLLCGESALLFHHKPCFLLLFLSISCKATSLHWVWHPFACQTPCWLLVCVLTCCVEAVCTSQFPCSLDLAVICHGVDLTEGESHTRFSHAWLSSETRLADTNECRIRWKTHRVFFAPQSHAHKHTFWYRFKVVSMVQSFYAVLSFLLSSIKGCWPSFISLCSSWLEL